MSAQPEALRLADELEDCRAPLPLERKAAAELRRQHADIQQLNAQVFLQMKWKTDLLGWQTLAPDDVVAAARDALEQDENERLLEMNAKLVEALTDLLGWQTLAPDDVVAAARAAIAKAEEVKP